MSVERESRKSRERERERERIESKEKVERAERAERAEKDWRQEGLNSFHDRIPRMKLNTFSRVRKQRKSNTIIKHAIPKADHNYLVQSPNPQFPSSWCYESVKFHVMNHDL